MNKTLLQIATFLLIPTLILADPAMAVGIAGGPASRPAASSFAARLSQEALADPAIPFLRQHTFLKATLAFSTILGLTTLTLADGAFLDRFLVGWTVVTTMLIPVCIFDLIASLVPSRRLSAAIKITVPLLVLALLGAQSAIAATHPHAVVRAVSVPAVENGPMHIVVVALEVFAGFVAMIIAVKSLFPSHSMSVGVPAFGNPIGAIRWPRASSSSESSPIIMRVTPDKIPPMKSAQEQKKSEEPTFESEALRKSGIVLTNDRVTPKLSYSVLMGMVRKVRAARLDEQAKTEQTLGDMTPDDVLRYSLLQAPFSKHTSNASQALTVSDILATYAATTQKNWRVYWRSNSDLVIVHMPGQAVLKVDFGAGRMQPLWRYSRTAWKWWLPRHIKMLNEFADVSRAHTEAAARAKPAEPADSKLPVRAQEKPAPGVSFVTDDHNQPALDWTILHQDAAKEPAPATIASEFGSYAKYVYKHETELAELLNRLTPEELSLVGTDFNQFVRKLAEKLNPGELVMDRYEKTRKELEVLRAAYGRHADLLRDIRRTAKVTGMSVARIKKLFIFAVMPENTQRELKALVLALKNDLPIDKRTPIRAARKTGLSTQKVRQMWSLAMEYPDLVDKRNREIKTSEDPIAFRQLVEGDKTYKDSPAAFRQLVRVLVATPYAQKILAPAPNAEAATVPIELLHTPKSDSAPTQSAAKAASFYSFLGLLPLFYLLKPALLASSGYLWQHIHLPSPLSVLGLIGFGAVAVVMQGKPGEEPSMGLDSMKAVRDLLSKIAEELEKDKASALNKVQAAARSARRPLPLFPEADTKVKMRQDETADFGVKKDKLYLLVKIDDAALTNEKEVFAKKFRDLYAEKGHTLAFGELLNHPGIKRIIRYIGGLEVAKPSIPRASPDTEAIASADFVIELSHFLQIDALELATQIKSGGSTRSGYDLDRIVGGVAALGGSKRFPGLQLLEFKRTRNMAGIQTAWLQFQLGKRFTSVLFEKNWPSWTATTLDASFERRTYAGESSPSLKAFLMDLGGMRFVVRRPGTPLKKKSPLDSAA